MRTAFSSFYLPKRGHQDTEYEDAFWPRLQQSDEGETFRYAVADGATEASYSGIWARLLVRAFRHGDFVGSQGEISDSLISIQKRWATVVNRRPLPWYAQEKAQIGSFAAFLGLCLREYTSIEKSNKGKWEATAIGDSCLFHIRGGTLLQGFPISNSGDFTNHPDLVSSNPTHNKYLAQKIRYMGGEWSPGDQFFLMTDAVSQWFLSEYENERKPWEEISLLRGRGNSSTFADVLQQLRDNSMIKNDDVTVLKVVVTD